MKTRGGFFPLWLVLILAAVGDLSAYPAGGGGSGCLRSIQGDVGTVISQVGTDYCFRYGNGRKIVRDKNDKLHVVYVDPYPSDPNDIPPSGGPYHSCTYATSADGGATWELTFLDDDYFSRYPAIAANGDTIHVVYTNWETYTSHSTIAYKRSTDGGETWSSPMNITSGDFANGDCDYAGLDVDLDGDPHVSFVWSHDGAVHWTMSSNGGDTWTLAEQVSYGAVNGTISLSTNVFINPHSNDPHIVFAGGEPGLSGNKDYYHSFYMDGIWSYPTEKITVTGACWGFGSLAIDADTDWYVAYLFVDDRVDWPPLRSYNGVGVYRRTDEFRRNLWIDPLDAWNWPPIVVADTSEAQFESQPWYPSAVINPGSDLTSADDDTIFCVFATGPGGQGGDIFIRYSTDEGSTWRDDWPRNPLTMDGDDGGDNWPEIDWGHWSPGHLDVVWVSEAADGWEIRYADAYEFGSDFVRGDVRADGNIDIFDGVRILYWLGGEAPAPPCVNAADADDSEGIDTFDGLRIFYWLGGAAEPPPAPCCGIPGDCGADPTPGPLSCVSYPPCGDGKAAKPVAFVGSEGENQLLVGRGERWGPETMVVPVVVTNAEPLVGLDFVIEYDARVATATAVDNTGLITEGFDLFVAGVEEPGVVKVVAVSDLKIGDGVERLPAGEHRVARIVFELEGKSPSTDVSLRVASSLMAMSHDRALNHQTVVGEPIGTPRAFELSQNHPNPFNVTTEIAYALPRKEHIKLAIYNLLGQRVRTLVEELRPAGHHVARWGGRNDEGNPVASGVYLCRLEAGDFSQTRRLLLIK